jgi:hypothetical protein
MNTKTNKQISNEELLELTNMAFEKDEVAEFLSGESGYACPVNRFVPAYVPTDFDRIVKIGIYKLYEVSKNEEIANKFKKAIERLINGSPVEIWIAFMVYWSQIRNEKKGESPFKFATQDLTDSLKLAILKNENALRVCKEWQGWNEENGLWQEITRINNMAIKNYEVSIL